MQGGQNVREGAARTYDSATNTLGTPVKDQDWGYGRQDDRGVMDKAGDYYQGAKDTVYDAAGATKDATMRVRFFTIYSLLPKYQELGYQLPSPANRIPTLTIFSCSQAGEATRDTAYGAMGYEAPSEKGYASQAYDSARDASSDAYEAGKDKLGSIIEVLGWRKAAEHERARSPYDVLVGNDRYVWNQRPNSDDSYYQQAKDTLGTATETTSEKATQATNGVYDTAGRAKDATWDAASNAKDAVVDTTNRAKDSVMGMTGQTQKTGSDYSQWGKETLGAGAGAVGAHALGQ